MSDSYKALRQALNPIFKGKNWEALLSALATGDDHNAFNLIAAKDQIRIATASDIYLKKLLSNLGVEYPTGVGMDDESFRELGIKQTNTKLVANIFLEILETFYGSEAIRASFQTGAYESYRLENGMTLEILPDGKSKPLIITFLDEDFEDISAAKADEIAAVITKQAFNLGFTVYAKPVYDVEIQEYRVQLFSGTKGSRSSLQVSGGNAQSVLQFPETVLAAAKEGTQFVTSFIDGKVRFIWIGGADPQLNFLNPDDKVVLSGDSISDENKGTFSVVAAVGGIMGQSYFEIVNPNFQPQGIITTSAVGGVSGLGTGYKYVDILAAPIGLVRSLNVVTVTTVFNHNLSIGNKVEIVNPDTASFAGTFTVAGTPSLNTFTYIQNGPDVTSGGGSVYQNFNIETAVSSGAIRNSGTTTITFTEPHTFLVGENITIINVEDSSFNGEFTVLTTTSNTVTYDQNISHDIFFYRPYKQNIQKLPRYASIYEVNPYEVIVYLPATANIIRRDLIGSWHLNDPKAENMFPGSYVFNTKEGFSITETFTKLNQAINAQDVTNLAFAQNTASFPDKEGFLVFEFGTENQEGPVRYLSRPSAGSLLIDPSYKFKKSHSIGSDITLISSTRPYQPATDGSDYQPYVTSTIQGRIEAEKLINNLAASGITVTIIIVYPKGPGLADIEQVYSGDEV